MQFAQQNIVHGLRDGIYKNISSEEAATSRSKVFVVISAFLVWKEEADGKEKDRFVVNVSEQSKYWHRGSVKTETLPSSTFDL